MKHLLNIISLLLLATSSVLAEEVTDTCAKQPILELLMSNRVKQFIDIRENTYIQHTTDSFIVSSKHLKLSYPRHTVGGYQFRYINDFSLDIKNVSTHQSSGGAITLQRDGNIITLLGVNASTSVRIYSINGKDHTNEVSITQQDNGVMTINFSNIPKGIYIISLKGYENAPDIKFTKI